MSVDTIRVSIPLKLSDVAHFQRIADPVRFFKVDTRDHRVLWTKVKGLAELNLPSHSRGIHWDLRLPKPGEVQRVLEETYGVVRSQVPGWEVVRSYFVAKQPGEGFEYTPTGVLEDFQLLDLELSLPKLVRGHNIALLHNPVDALHFLKAQLEAEFDFILPDLGCWFVSRLDVSHAYRFETQEIAQLVLNGLKGKRFPHKKATVYDTSINYPGKEYTFKIYLKQPEYKVNSLRKDYKLVGERADEWCESASGVLRIEIGLKSGSLSKVTGQKYHILSDVLDQLPKAPTTRLKGLQRLAFRRLALKRGCLGFRHGNAPSILPTGGLPSSMRYVSLKRCASYAHS